MNVRSFDLNLLRVVAMLLEERSATGAATRLGLTQPAISAALNRLRDTFDDPLFIRAERGMAPTIRGEEVARAAQNMLREMDGLLASTPFEPSTAQWSLAVGANDYAQFSVVAPLFHEVRKTAPGIRFEIRPLEHDIGGQLDRQDIDVAITLLSNPPRKAMATPLFSERFVGAVDLGNTRVGQKISLDDFCSFDHVRVSAANNRLADPVDDNLMLEGRSRNVVLTVPNYFMIPRLLRGSELFAVVPERLVRYFEWTLKPVALPLTLPGFSINLIWHERSSGSARHAWLRNQLTTIAHEFGDSALRDPEKSPPRAGLKDRL